MKLHNANCIVGLHAFLAIPGLLKGYASVKLLVHHIVGHALLRLDIQLQVGNWRAFFGLPEVGLGRLYQRVQLHLAVLELHDDGGLEAVCLCLALGAGFRGGRLFFRRHGLSAALLFGLGLNGCGCRFFLVHIYHPYLIICWVKFPAHYIW